LRELRATSEPEALVAASWETDSKLERAGLEAGTLTAWLQERLTQALSCQMTIIAAVPASIILSSSGCPFNAILDGYRVRARWELKKEINQSKNQGSSRVPW
jgi:hypothetical protein